MNKNLLVIAYFVLALAALAILVMVALIDPDQLDKVVQYILTVLGLASSAAVTFYMLGKQANDIAEVKAQTNGTLSALREENANLHNQVLELATTSTPAPEQKAKA